MASCAGKFRPRRPWEGIAARGGSESSSSAQDHFGPCPWQQPGGEQRRQGDHLWICPWQQPTESEKIGRSLMDLSMAATGEERRDREITLDPNHL